MLSSDLLPQLIAQRAVLAGSAPFLHEVQGPDLTAEDVHDDALRWAALLAAHGVQAGEPVVSMLSTSAAALRSWLGAGWLGAIDVPLNPEYQGSVLRSVLQLVEPRTIVVEGHLLPRLQALQDCLPSVRTVLTVGPGADIRTRWDVLDAARVLPEMPLVERRPPASSDVSCGILTSGTTGPSKCVLVPWGQIHQMYGVALGRDWGPDEATYVHGPMHHLIARGLIVQGALAPEGRVVLRRKYATQAWWDDVRRYRCTEANVPAVVARWLWERPPAADDGDNPLRRICIAPQIPEARAFARRFDVQVVTAYGSTEVGIPFMTADPEADPSSCGRLAPGVEVRIADAERGDEAVPDGQPGELLVRGAPGMINLGYFRLRDVTAEAWRGGWFHTGDAFRRDCDGNYYFVDRYKDVIRRRGENVSSVEIEREADQHPAVLQSAAVAVPSEFAEDDIKLFVEPTAGVDLDPSELLQYLRIRLPRFMLPRYVEVVPELPRTETGRVQKGPLKALPKVGVQTLEFSGGGR